MPGSKLGYFNSVLTDAGRPLAATITVFDQGTATPSTIYADAGGVTPLANPFSTDAIGRFQFYAATGKYDVQVSGAGITTYKIQNVSLSDISLISELMDVTTYFCVTPEQYGAVGDGATDDWAAFHAMFADLAAGGAYAGTVRRKIILNPDVYYSIQSRLNATNVFEVAVPNIIFEGPGMGLLTMQYEGAQTATNFLYMPDACRHAKFSELYIQCGVGDDSNTRDLSKITNIIAFNNTLITTLERVKLVGCTGAGITGFNWMTEIRHCNATWTLTGFDSINTTAFVVNNYANMGTAIKAGSIGFNINSVYGFYAGNACDWGDIAYRVTGSTVSLQGNGSEHCNQYLKSTGGGYIYLDGFAGNNDADPGLPAAWIEMEDAVGHISGNTASVYNPYILQTTNCPDLIISGISKDKILVLDAPTVYRDPIRMENDWTGGKEQTVAVADFETLVTVTLRNYKGCRDAAAIIPDGTVTYAATLKLLNMSGCGKFTFQRQSGAGTTHFTFDQAAGNGFEIENIHVPLYFDGGWDPTTLIFIFHQTGTGTLFKLTNCQLVRFYNTILDAGAGSGDVFELDDFSNLVLDKTVMDFMDVTNFSGLCNKPERIKFTGYTDKPTVGLFDVGCRIDFTAPAAGGYPGCVCTTAGATGVFVFKYLAAIEA